MSLVRRRQAALCGDLVLICGSLYPGMDPGKGELAGVVIDVVDSPNPEFGHTKLYRLLVAGEVLSTLGGPGLFRVVQGCSQKGSEK